MTEALKRKVVNLAKAVTPMEEALRTKASPQTANPSGVSPSALGGNGNGTDNGTDTATGHQQSSHHSNH